MQGYCNRSPAFVVGRVFLLEPSRNRVHLGLCSTEFHTGFQPCDNGVMMFPPDRALGISPRHRCPDFRKIRKTHSLRHHSHNQVALAVQVHALTDNLRVRSKMLLPKTMAKDNHLTTAVLIFIRREGAAHTWLDLEHRKEIRGDIGSGDLFGMVGSS